MRIVAFRWQVKLTLPLHGIVLKKIKSNRTFHIPNDEISKWN